MRSPVSCRRCSRKTWPGWPARTACWRGWSNTTQANDAWRVRHGPFAEDDFPGLPDHDWTLLVQDMDKWDADIRGLLAHFAFLPRWRIDDVMVSFAATGGSVGAHVDQYDVFLLQAQGRRRWQIDASATPAARLPPRCRTQVAARIPSHPRLGAGTRRHALPAAGRAAPRRRGGPLPDLFGGHARAVGGGAAGRFRGCAGRRRAPRTLRYAIPTWFRRTMRTKSTTRRWRAWSRPSTCCA